MSALVPAHGAHGAIWPQPEHGEAQPAGAISNGALQPAFWSHQADRTDPSGPAQNTSTCSCSRATAAIVPPGLALPAGAMVKGLLQAELLRFWSHQVPRIEPSAAAQNTSTCSCSRATAATVLPGVAAPAARSRYQERPGLGDSLVDYQRLEPLSELVGRQPPGRCLRVPGLQHAEPQLAKRDRRDAPLKIGKPADLESCRPQADEHRGVGQRPLGHHHDKSSVVSVSAARNSSASPVVSGPSRASSWLISGAGSHCRRRDSGMILATGRLSLRTSISSPDSTRRSTSAVWLRRSRAGILLIRRM
jgi:hypothetical protein